jgi:hypothetical protein
LVTKANEGYIKVREILPITKIIKNNMIDLAPYFGSLAAVAGVVMMLSGWLKTHVIKVDGIKAQLLTWLISIGIAFFGQWQDAGIFADNDILMTVLNGIGVGLVANGLYSIEVVQKVLELVKAKIAKR